MGNLILKRVASNLQNHLSSRAEVMESSRTPPRVGMTWCTWYEMFSQMMCKPLLCVSSNRKIKILVWSLYTFLLKMCLSLWLTSWRQGFSCLNLASSLLSNYVLKTAAYRLYYYSRCALHICCRFCTLLIFLIVLGKLNTYLAFYFSCSLNIIWNFFLLKMPR